MRLSILFALSAAFGLTVLNTACADDGCKTNGDCPAGRICRLGLCALDPGLTDTNVQADALFDVALACEPATATDLVLNEILADPPPGADVNGDGTASTTDDEFVEIVNVSNREVALTNVQIDVGGKKVAAGAICLPPNGARVIYGKDGLPGLTNGGSAVSLVIDGLVAQTHSYGAEGGNDQSLTLAVQLDPTSSWVKHKELATAAYSPGKCANGNDFPNCAGSPPVEGDADVSDGGGEIVAACSAVPVAGDLVINEILADPGAVNDANQDGTTSGTEDEFVEVVNVSAKMLLLSGVTIWDATTNRFTFAPGTCLAPAQAAVAFGKYETGGEFAGALAFGSTGTLSLNNSSSGGDTVTLKDALGGILDQVDYGSEANSDQSITRAVDGDLLSAFVKHTEAAGSGGARMSPGRCHTGGAFPNCEVTPVEDMPDTVGDVTPVDASDADAAGDTMSGDEIGPVCGPGPLAGDLRINEIMANPGGVHWSGDATDDSSVNKRHEFVEIVNRSGHAIEAAGVQLVVGTSVKYTVGTRSEPTTCLSAGEVILVFGGGAPTLAPPGVVVVTAGLTDGLALTNTGNDLTLKTAVGDIDKLHYPQALEGKSWVRNPEGIGELVDHSTVTGAVGNGSPGTCTSGAAFPGCLP